ncbi:MAG: hypothetical protein HY073_03970, partial [Deltaproteobacteria bacterium]|nr:hypothetical protein [Deltaproteobacteria bacterium]
MNFYRRFLLLILSMAALVSFYGCGEINQPETVDTTDTKLSGQWTADKLNGNGDRVLLTFAPDDSTGKVVRNATLEAIRPGGGLVTIGSGTYTIQQGTKLLFNLDSVPNYTTAFALTPSRLTLGTDVYNKVTASLNGPQVGGQIQITQGSADESVGVNSVGTQSSSQAIPGRILVRMKTGEMGVLNVARPNVSDLPGLFIESSKTSLTAAAFTQLEIQDQWEQDTRDALQDCRAKGVQCSRDVLLSTQSLTNPTDPRFNEQWNLEVLNATDAWGIATSTQQVVVAVIDTG